MGEDEKYKIGLMAGWTLAGMCMTDSAIHAAIMKMATEEKGGKATLADMFKLYPEDVAEEIQRIQHPIKVGSIVFDKIEEKHYVITGVRDIYVDGFNSKGACWCVKRENVLVMQDSTKEGIETLKKMLAAYDEEYAQKGKVSNVRIPYRGISTDI